MHICPTEKIEKTVIGCTMTLSKEEMEILYAISGSVLGQGKLRTFTDSLYYTLQKSIGNYYVCTQLCKKYGITQPLHANDEE